ncbi:MAG: Transcriptional regulatory protein DegU [Phycisphaerae bacterium]|nr:Transcriptional regulatory protein DegU [Phycisphaerae bacterium]
MSIRIVLADDHSMVREGLRTILEREEDLVVVGEAENGREAVSLARRLSPDVVVMDVAMSECNGVEATRQILAARPEVRVIALSTYSDRRYVTQMLAVGALGYVLKSAAGSELIRGIRSVWTGKRYLSSEISGIAGPGPDGSAGPASPADLLAPREREVLQLLAEGRSSKVIAATLRISPRTAEAHRRNIMRKLDLHSVAELTKFAVRAGLTSLEG